ncbi:MAG: hypothetical protein F6K41_37395 [Symploca sp. SIO3E6]|nr:hypothetical protein [Caldora sp. SIO3E6]
MSLSRERRSRGAEERRKKNIIFLNPWSISIYRFFLEPLRHIWELTKCTTFSLVTIAPHPTPRQSYQPFFA